MKDKELSHNQKSRILSLVDDLELSTDIVLPHHPESEDLTPEDIKDIKMVNAVVGLVFHHIVKGENNGSESGLERKDVRRLSGTIINNEPGSRNLFDAKHGFDHSIPGYSRFGRNHSNKVHSRGGR